MKILFELFITFARIGLFTFGGGYAMLPLLQREIVEKRTWITEEELMDYYAVGQCTPGIISVNTATFVGEKQAKTSGAIAATLGIVFPSIVIITLIAAFISNFAQLPLIKNAFAGIRVCVCILVINAVVKFMKSSVKDVFTVIVFLAVFVGAAFIDVSPIILVVIAAIAGLIAKIPEVKKQ